jgi:hypothetical protein
MKKWNEEKNKKQKIQKTMEKKKPGENTEENRGKGKQKFERSRY